MTDDELDAIEARTLDRGVLMLVREVRRLRSMFDVTRHRVCDRLGVERGASWFRLEGMMARLRAAERLAEADDETEMWLREVRDRCDACINGIVCEVHRPAYDCRRELQVAALEAYRKTR
jgi:hypothetical protein